MTKSETRDRPADKITEEMKIVGAEVLAHAWEQPVDAFIKGLVAEIYVAMRERERQ